MVRPLLLALLCALASQAQAQSGYPSRPVRIVVPSPPAGGTDIIARVLAQYFSNSMASSSSWRTGRARAT
jgi:tripartite-type tricarboxylate transporter receptor subunit TctC